MVCLSSFLGSFSRVAFCGSRLSASSASASCRAFLPLVSGFSVPVGVGCGSGSWGSVALALGLGCSVLVVAPVGVGSAWFGALASHFRCVGSAPCGGLLWCSAPFPAPSVGGQLSLF